MLTNDLQLRVKTLHSFIFKFSKQISLFQNYFYTHIEVSKLKNQNFVVEVLLHQRY